MKDVIVIGGGMTGGYCAFQLASHGLKTLLLERGEIASGASGRGGGLLLKGATDLFAPEIVPHLRLNQRLLEEFLELTRAEVEYLRGGSLYVAFEEDWDFTRNEVKRLNDAGLPAELWDHQELRRQIPQLTGKAVGGRFIPDDAQLSSSKLAWAFVEAARQAGAEIRPRANVTALLEDQKHTVCGVRVCGEEITADWVVLATNAYTADLIPALKKLIVPTRGQAFLTASLSRAFPFACAANYDLEYWRQTRSEQILFGGCRRFETQGNNGIGTESTETTEDVLLELRKTFDFLFPCWNEVEIEKNWAGTMGFTSDYKPLIGPVPDHSQLLIGAGFSGNCLPLVCVTGLLLREIILRGATTVSLSPFAPGRFLASGI